MTSPAVTWFVVAVLRAFADQAGQELEAVAT
jgi:hypothetical protein